MESVNVYKPSTPIEMFESSWENNAKINDTTKNVQLLVNTIMDEPWIKNDIKKFIRKNFLTSFSTISNHRVNDIIVQAWGGYPDNEGTEFLKSLYNILDIAKVRWSDFNLQQPEITVLLVKNKNIENEKLHQFLIDQSIFVDQALVDIIVNERGIDFLCDLKWEKKSIQSLKSGNEDKAEVQSGTLDKCKLKTLPNKYESDSNIINQEIKPLLRLLNYKVDSSFINLGVWNDLGFNICSNLEFEDLKSLKSTCITLFKIASKYSEDKFRTLFKLHKAYVTENFDSPNYRIKQKALEGIRKHLPFSLPPIEKAKFYCELAGTTISIYNAYHIHGNFDSSPPVFDNSLPAVQSVIENYQKLAIQYYTEAAVHGEASALQWLTDNKEKYPNYLIQCGLGEFYLEQNNTAMAQEHLFTAHWELFDLLDKKPLTALKILNDQKYCELFSKVGIDIEIHVKEMLISMLDKVVLKSKDCQHAYNWFKQIAHDEIYLPLIYSLPHIELAKFFYELANSEGIYNIRAEDKERYLEHGIKYYVNAAGNEEVLAVDWLKNFDHKQKYQKFLILCAFGKFYLKNEKTTEAEQCLHAALNEICELWCSELERKVPSKARSLMNDLRYEALFSRAGIDIQFECMKIIKNMRKGIERV